MKLVNTYYTLFREYGIKVGQVLVVKENFTSPREYANLRACMSVMLESGVMPVVNENDTVSVTEPDVYRQRRVCRASWRR